MPLEIEVPTLSSDLTARGAQQQLTQPCISTHRSTDARCFHVENPLTVCSTTIGISPDAALLGMSPCEKKAGIEMHGQYCPAATADAPSMLYVVTTRLTKGGGRRACAALNLASILERLVLCRVSDEPNPDPMQWL